MDKLEDLTTLGMEDLTSTCMNHEKAEKYLRQLKDSLYQVYERGLDKRAKKDPDSDSRNNSHGLLIV